MTRNVVTRAAGAFAFLAVATALGILACGEEPIGTNEPNDQYFPTVVGSKWTYDTYNLTRDPSRSKAFYTQVSLDNLPPATGGDAKPTFSYKFAKNVDGEGFRLDQAGYWVNKDIYYRYDYFDYSTKYFTLNGYHYLNEFREPVIGTFFTDGDGNLNAQTLFITPFSEGETWDVLVHDNPDPIGDPTVFLGLNPDDYFGLRRDMDHDGEPDTFDLSIVGNVEGSQLIQLDNGKQMNCFKIVHTQTIVFHLTSDGDVTDVSHSTYFIAPRYGYVQVNWYNGSAYLDEIEMTLLDWWFPQ